MKDAAIEKYAWLVSMVGTYKAMPQAEKDDLLLWERQNLDGHSVGTSDWPGWKKYIGSKPVFEKQEDRNGFLYLFGSATGLFKIGQSINVEKRLREIRSNSPVKVELIHQLRSDDRFASERILHTRFACHRRHNEWFSLPAGAVLEICELKRFEKGTFRRR